MWLVLHAPIGRGSPVEPIAPARFGPLHRHYERSHLTVRAAHTCRKGRHDGRRVSIEGRPLADTH